jgi:hypothetical protein
MLMFTSFNAWRDHEMNHRREWVCPSCGLLCENQPKAIAHFIRSHGDSTRDMEIDTLLQMSSRLPEHLNAADCPFCDWSSMLLRRDTNWQGQEQVVPSIRFMRHLGHHLEQIALFIVPRPYEEEGEDLEDLGSNEVYVNMDERSSLSTLSSFGSEAVGSKDIDDSHSPAIDGTPSLTVTGGEGL